MAKKENIFKRIWNFLGDNEESLSEEEKKEVEALNLSTKGSKKEIVPKVNAGNKPIDINDIVPQPENSRDDEGR